MILYKKEIQIPEVVVKASTMDSSEPGTVTHYSTPEGSLKGEVMINIQ